jgi:hypothetical protein
LPGMYAFWSGCRSLVHAFISSLVLLPIYFCPCNPLKPTTVSILLSSLFYYFFQYVKERFVELKAKCLRLKAFWRLSALSFAL